jgi:hypothetical protein
MPTPASSSSPMRLPFRSPDRFIQSASCSRQAHAVAVIGFESTDIINAASSTVRVIGPAQRAT